jgi:hypothetical protein
LPFISADIVIIYLDEEFTKLTNEIHKMIKEELTMPFATGFG